MLKAGLKLLRAERGEEISVWALQIAGDRQAHSCLVESSVGDKHAVPRWNVEAGQRKTAAAGLQVGTER